MSALGQKQTFALQQVMSALTAIAMSALHLKADTCGANRHVCFGPIADMTARLKTIQSYSRLNARFAVAFFSSSVSWGIWPETSAVISSLTCGELVRLHDLRRLPRAVANCLFA